MSKFIERCHGASAALPTPYTMGKVDFHALEAFCNRLIDRGIAALVPCGTTGEAPLLTADEHHRVVAQTVAAANGRVPVIAGAGSNNTATAVELARSAERAGASALLCVTPPYLKPTQAGMMVHFRTIHDAVGIPIILYDVPSRTACALDDVTIRRLAELPRIVGLKDATGDIPRVARLRRRLGDEFLLLSGDDASQAAFRLAGGDGCISVTANVAPVLVRGPAPGLRREAGRRHPVVRAAPGAASCRAVPRGQPDSPEARAEPPRADGRRPAASPDAAQPRGRPQARARPEGDHAGRGERGDARPRGPPP